MKTLFENYRDHSHTEPLFYDDGQTLHRFDRCGETVVLGYGKLLMYRDRLAFLGDGRTDTFYFKDITHMAIHGGKVLVFSTVKGEHYEIKNERPRSARKYLAGYETLKQ